MGLREIVDQMGKALAAPSDGGFRHTGGLLGEEKAAVRERMQAKTAPEIAMIIKKLKVDQEITPQDIDLIRLWIVGDAHGYVDAENDYQHWLTEYGRLREVLEGFADRDLGVEELVRVQGLLEDTVRVSFDIANYLEKKERIENFDQTTRDPAQINKQVLAALLSRKLESGES